MIELQSSLKVPVDELLQGLVGARMAMAISICPIAKIGSQLSGWLSQLVAARWWVAVLSYSYMGRNALISHDQLVFRRLLILHLFS